MSIGRISWLIVILACAIAATATFIAGYAGYGVTVCAVGLAAAVNLLPDQTELRGTGEHRPPKDGAAAPSPPSPGD